MLLPGFVSCISNGWGSPFRIDEKPEDDRPFHVVWTRGGLGRGKPKPADWHRLKFATRREAQLAIASAFLVWLSHPDQADLVAGIREQLRGKDLACCCGPKTPCHVDILLYIANRGCGPFECDLPSYPEPDGGQKTMSQPIPFKARRSVKLHVRGIKVTTLIAPDALPADLVAREPHPPGEAVIDLQLEGASLVVRARINGKSVRRALKTIAEHGAGNVNLMIQGNLKPSTEPGAPFVLDAAGLSATPKTPKPEAP